MSELRAIEAVVRRTAQRRRWQRAWRGLWQGFLLGSAGLLLALALFKLLPVPISILAWAGAIMVLACLGGFLTGWWRRESLLETARWLDDREALKERLSTALEIGPDERLGRWRELLVRDAAGHAGQVDPRRLLPFRLPQTSRWALLTLALAAGLGFVPEYRSQTYLQARREREAIRQSGRTLAELSKRSLEKRPPALERTRESLKAVGELGGQLERNPTTRSEALRELAKMSETLRQETRDALKNPALQTMQKAANTSGRQPTQNAEQLQKQIEALQKAMDGKNPKPDALDQLQKQLTQLQQQAANLAAQGSQASDAAKDSLSRSLSSLARSAEQMGASLSSLDEAVAALEAGQIDQMLKNLEVAEKDLEKLRELAQALQQAQQQAEQLGRDLAEQLKRGQAEAAISTLQKMINELKTGKLTPEQQQALMDEINKALPNAAPYGKVPEHLREALRKLQTADQPAAARALADAAKELKDLLDQLGDAQDMMAMVESLQRAQMAVATGQCWGQGSAGSRPGFKPGGKPGQGVGTWADEEGWTGLPEETGLWDNSGIERPDLDPRGLTERDPTLPDSLTPTKVKGQFQPGQQMPSITLRGVSIKGQSTVAVQEAITAAQSDAQAALSQEQVPRAYQGTVKSYFDDLK
jgi:arginine repressor